MRKLFTILSAMLLAVSAFAATEQAWYNDVTSITANGQYYIYSVKGKGFVQGGQDKVKAITATNYNSTNGLLFTITKTDAGKTYNGSNYLSSYQYGTCGPIGNAETSGSDICWTWVSNSFWNIHGKYNFSITGTKYACLKYNNEYSAAANILGQKETQTGEEYRFWLISQAQYNRHFAIYFFDAYKETVTDYTQYNGLVPAAYYTALEAAYNQTFSVQNAAHSAEVVNAAKANLETLYTGAADVATAYATATGAINALEAVEDKGEDFAEVTTDITNARTAIEEAMSVDEVNAAVANLKAIDPITFHVTEFVAPNFVTNAASSAAARAISYNAADKAVINANGQAIYVGTTTLTATAAATDAYYKFVRSAQVTVTAPTTYGEFSETTCGEAVEFNEQTYEESFAGEVHLTNIYGGDSVVTVSITINTPSDSTDVVVITYGDAVNWNGYDLSTYAVGKYTETFTTTNVAGCDSVVTLDLTVNKQATVELTYPIEFCADDEQEYRGVVYTEAGSFPLDLIEGAISDTLITVEVTVNDKVQTIDYQEDSVGVAIELPEGEWLLGDSVVIGSYELQVADTAGLEFVQYGETEKGCESVAKIIVTVLYEEETVDPGQTTALERVKAQTEAVKEFRNGTLYIRRGERLFTAEGREVK